MYIVVIWYFIPYNNPLKFSQKGVLYEQDDNIYNISIIAI